MNETIENAKEIGKVLKTQAKKVKAAAEGVAKTAEEKLQAKLEALQAKQNDIKTQLKRQQKLAKERIEAALSEKWLAAGKAVQEAGLLDKSPSELVEILKKAAKL